MSYKYETEELRQIMVDAEQINKAEAKKEAEQNFKLWEVWKYPSSWLIIMFCIALVIWAVNHFILFPTSTYMPAPPLPEPFPSYQEWLKGIR